MKMLEMVRRMMVRTVHSSKWIMGLDEEPNGQRYTAREFGRPPAVTVFALVPYPVAYRLFAGPIPMAEAETAAAPSGRQRGKRSRIIVRYLHKEKCLCNWLVEQARTSERWLHL